MKRQSLIKKSTEVFLKLIALISFLMFMLQSTSRAENAELIDKVHDMVRKTEIITTFDWKQDVSPSIGTISIEDEGRTVGMTGNGSLPGKNAIYIPDFESCVSYLKNNVQKDDIVLTLGAGSVTEIGPMLLDTKKL